MKDLILDFVRKAPGCLFSDLEREIPGFSGEGCMQHPEFENVIYWDRISPAAVEALAGLIASGDIIPRPATLIAYTGSRMPPLPIGRREIPYKTPHWLPAYFMPRA
ncbi:MAG: hypothetical protein LBO05_04170 [Deltaproteobacteria bacterium]|jgi:hypothetical protein|nr:hypothetical protein [Deltaproteobacteria bacterium]